MKKSRSNYYARIERIQKWVNDNPGVSVNQMLDDFSDTPRGTVSATLSTMLAAGHLIRGAKGFYSLPPLVASPKSVAIDIDKFKRSPSLFKKPSAQFKDKMKIREIMERNTPAPKVENRNEAILNAVDTLKTFGIKVTLEF